MGHTAGLICGMSGELGAHCRSVGDMEHTAVHICGISRGHRACCWAHWVGLGSGGLGEALGNLGHLAGQW